jgi:type II secretory ATPase GspE/PulE/Tfp pilus assembly ATPase PilB-like protein
MVAVTLGLLDGRALTGTIRSFSPFAMRLTVEIAEAGVQRSIERRVAAVHVAYVAFHAPPSTSGVTSATIDTPITLRVRVAGERSFVVEASATEIEKPPGFFGVPVEPGPYQRIFFYTRGVKAKEDPALLGALLVRDGLLDEAQLARGIDAQRGGGLAVRGPAPPASTAPRPGTRTGEYVVGDFLVAEGLLTEAQVESALDANASPSRRLGQILVEMGLIEEGVLYQRLAKKFHLPFVDLDQLPVNHEAQKVIDEETLRTYNVLPIDVDARGIVVAITDPLATEVYDILRFQSGRDVIQVLAAPTQVARYLERLSGPTVESEGQVLEILGQLETEEASEITEAASVEAASVEAADTDSAIVRLANRIILDACQQGASDIHVEPSGKEENVRVRFRVDGECQLYQEFPPRLRRTLVARFKIMAGLDIAERRRPQDGKIRFRQGAEQTELRVATLPTTNDNEDVVLRILASSKPMPLEEMGMTPRNLEALQAIIAKPYGLILCVGPTGSGKTTTLHSVLRQLNTVDMKIWTAEDPVEITQKGLRQVPISSKIGFSFADAMRSFLRADPDVIMVGEMRDFETAAIAVQASLTGHMVCSTLHTNSAAETITRLLDMGMEPFTFADALLGILAQRLARGLCPTCRQPHAATAEEFEAVAELYGKEPLAAQLGVRGAADLRLWQAPGCAACAGKGYRGRIALHELLIASDKVRECILRHDSIAEIREQAMQDGMTTLMQDGVEKALQGKTDLKQVVSVCSR